MTTPIEAAFAKVAAGCAFHHDVHLNAAETVALADWIRRAKNELNTPYQCYWRQRAMKAEKTTVTASSHTTEGSGTA